MARRMRWIERRVVVLGVAAIGVVAIAGTALAGHETSGVKSYTGCLISGDGVMIKIKEGNAPKSACSGGQVQAHFSGGDITKISVGSGLSLPSGGDNGEVRIELAAGQTLPSGCATGRVVEWSGSAWICGVDNDTTYAAGTGLNLDTGETPDEFSIAAAYRLPGKSCSTAGEFARGFNSSGEIQCAAPTSSSGVEVWQKSAAPVDSIDLPNGEGVDLVVVPLPAGTFLITAVATVRDVIGGSADDQVRAQCRLRNGAFAALPVNGSSVDIGEGQSTPGGTILIHGLLTLASGDNVRFTCFGDGDANRAESVTFTAVKVGTVHAP